MNALEARQDTQSRPTQDERRHARRQAILDTAEMLFLEQGFPAVSLNAIIQRSGGSLATIYQMFGNKQGLLRAVVNRSCDKSLREVETLFDSDMPLRTLLEEIALRYHEFTIRPNAIALKRLVITESLNDPEFGRVFDRDMQTKYIANLAAMFSAWNVEGRMKIDRPMDAAELFCAMALCNEPMRVLFGLPVVPKTREAIAQRLAPFLDYFEVED